VQNAWIKLAQGISPLNILHNKVQNTTRELKLWSKKLLGNARNDLHLANEIIHHLEVPQESRALSENEQEVRKDMKNRILGLAVVE
jgi:hypothetical protein